MIDRALFLCRGAVAAFAIGAWAGPAQAWVLPTDNELDGALNAEIVDGDAAHARIDAAAGWRGSVLGVDLRQDLSLAHAGEDGEATTLGAARLRAAFGDEADGAAWFGGLQLDDAGDDARMRADFGLATSVTTPLGGALSLQAETAAPLSGPVASPDHRLSAAFRHRVGAGLSLHARAEFEGAGGGADLARALGVEWAAGPGAALRLEAEPAARDEPGAGALRLSLVKRGW